MDKRSLIEDFFSNPGINKSGMCAEAGIQIRHLNRVINGETKVTKNFLMKILPVIIKYSNPFVIEDYRFDYAGYGDNYTILDKNFKIHEKVGNIEGLILIIDELSK